MKQLVSRFNKEMELIDKFLSITIFFIPLSLAISIFFADFFASISGLILIVILFKKENLKIFNSIKKEIVFFLFLYFIILVSLALTNFKSHSFLPSFFYFRYFLLSLSIFYLLKKYNFFLKFFNLFFLISIFFVITDAFIQQFSGFNIFGYKKMGLDTQSVNYLTGFFHQEKKLGSYLVRFLPLILSLIYFYKTKISVKYEIFFMVSIGVIVLLASERTALFLLILIYFCYFMINGKTLYFFSIIILLSGLTLFFGIKKTHNGVKPTLIQKYILSTITQTKLYMLIEGRSPKNRDIIRYYSYEHENLLYTGLINFRNNPLFGSGVKTFFQECSELKKKSKFVYNSRNNTYVCSTHPHSTYIQILAETGVFAFFLVFYLFMKCVHINLKILFRKNQNNLNKAHFFINLSIIVNLMPLIPSGSFYNNWMCLIMFLPLGFWLYFNKVFSK